MTAQSYLRPNKCSRHKKEIPYTTDRETDVGKQPYFGVESKARLCATRLPEKGVINHFYTARSGGTGSTIAHLYVLIFICAFVRFPLHLRVFVKYTFLPLWSVCSPVYIARKLQPEPGFEPAAFRSRVQCLNHSASQPPPSIHRTTAPNPAPGPPPVVRKGS